MDIDHDRLYVAMAEKLLDRADINGGSLQVRMGSDPQDDRAPLFAVPPGVNLVLLAISGTH